MGCVSCVYYYRRRRKAIDVSLTAVEEAIEIAGEGFVMFEGKALEDYKQMVDNLVSAAASLAEFVEEQTNVTPPPKEEL